MLTSLTIRQLAIIEFVQLDFEQGLTVLTGETGAGKSILIDALGLLLGDKADAGWVRQGAEQADVQATFVLLNEHPATVWLQEQSITVDGELLLRRVITKDGRARAYVNGVSVTVTQLRELGTHLIDIHGQHEHQRLINAAAQRELLDQCGKNTELVLQMKEQYRHWRQLQDEYERLRAAQTDRVTRLDLLHFQVQELEQAGVHNTDIDECESRHKRAMHGAEMAQLSAQASHFLNDDEKGALRLLHSAIERCKRLAQLDSDQQKTVQALEESLVQIQELSHDLQRYSETMEIDEAEAAELDQRITHFHHLARKHRIDMRDLSSLHQRLYGEWHDLQNSGQRLDDLENAIQLSHERYVVFANELTAKRHAAASEMSLLVVQFMQQLGMSDGKFSVQCQAREDLQPHPDGMEKIEFLVTANAGQPLRPLSKVASGGELSRISLAIQIIQAKNGSSLCMIFDEVDVGVGGATADMVGSLLRQLGDAGQVLCVTHQAQVAAKGHNHWRVQKSSDGIHTKTDVIVLNKKDRVDEIARMVGGVTITDKTRSHARELLR